MKKTNKTSKDSLFKSFMKKLCYLTYRKIFPNYQMELEKAIGNCKTLLDVGCGSSSPIKGVSSDIYCVGVDIFGPDVEKSKAQGIHDKYYKMNALNIGKKFKSNSFECVLASDLIEHLTKREGLRLLKMMERISSKKVIVFTPNGFFPQEPYGNNPWQIHKSGWTVEDMKKMGYDVIGINGWKPLRKQHASIRFWPKYFWLVISDMTQLFVRNHPEKAFQLLCMKEKFKEKG
jgi:predicted TPR repeat methyltransferase